MLSYPDINPIAFQLGFIKVRWYGLMYLVGLLAAWVLLTYRSKKRPELNWTSEQISDLIFYGALGIIIGGRLGYMLFYDLPDFIHNPLLAFKTWDGGMSFHGGFLGVLCSMWWFSRKTGKHFVDITDFIAPVVPLGLAAGRIGNFINGELWGKITDVPWAMVFPTGGPFPRHPSQLYEFLLEGVLLFIVLWFFSAKPRPRYQVSGLFLLGYGLARFICEFFRVPDPQLGYLAFHWLTMGQLLSLPMILGGAFLLVYT
ncbi:MAG: prolipoprotein diacylglyceryl transferase, partial [Legionellales bacterium]|nr:prolipoprotein diacylglyceryl transferase [Legionellales bacterium]